MTTIMNQAQTCPNCGKPLPAGALAGLCPACLLAQGAETETREGGQPAGFVPPPLERVARLFPQLEVIGLLGAGGMGAVYKARQTALQRFVALKILPATDAGGANFEERFNREARALARLSHPNIVTVHEFGEVDGLHYFIMEFVDGVNLRQLEKVGRLAPREALQIIPQICDALQYAHDEGVVHRDIKPENVLVDRKGRVKIADFGLAKILGQDPEALRLTQEGQVMGTPHYMAPEQIEHPLSVDHRADIYSLGVVLYEMLTGDLPIGKFPPPSSKVQVDVRFDEVVLRALENDPERRYQHASEVKSRVATIAVPPSTTGEVAAPPFVAPRFSRWAGFRLVRINNGPRTVDWGQSAFALAVIFGVLTILFGLVTLASGRSLMGWMGVVGLPSVMVRLALAMAILAWGIHCALRSPEAPQQPMEANADTLMVHPERLSRKAVLGVCWAPSFPISAFLWVVPFTVVSTTMNSGTSPSSGTTILWWQWLLIITILVPGALAPFGTTILGWLAVADIRRSKGRIGGLLLAIFDGLLFPLLALDVLIYLALVATFRSLGEGQIGLYFQGPSAVPITIFALTLCGLVDYWIVRGVWRSVRLARTQGEGNNDWWWSQKAGAVIIAFLCFAILIGVPSRRGSSSTARKHVDQQATEDRATGILSADLPQGGRVEVLAVGYRDAAPNQWWRPSGEVIREEFWQVENLGEATFNFRTNRDMIFRLIDLPEGANQASFEFEPSAGYTSGGGEVFRNRVALRGASGLRVSVGTDVETLEMRMGLGLVPWRTVATHQPKTRSANYFNQHGDPMWNISLNNVCDTTEGAQITVVMSAEHRDWNRKIVALDTQGSEHAYSSGQGTPGSDSSTWTYTFHNLPLKQVAEFRVQVQPIYWVGFSGIRLNPNNPLPVAQPPVFLAACEVTLTNLIDFDTGKMQDLPVAGTSKTDGGGYEALVRAEQEGFDAVGGDGELQNLGMIFAALDNECWDTLSPSELTNRLKQNNFKPPTLKPWKNEQLPSTFGFRTREGGTGLMQLLHFGETKRWVTLRYKLIKQPLPEAP